MPPFGRARITLKRFDEDEKTVNKTLAFAAAAIAIGLATHVEAKEKQMSIDFGDGSSVAIDGAGSQVQAKYRDIQPNERVTLDRKLESLLRRSDSFQFLLTGQNADENLAIIVSSLPSRATGGTGFCGAGHEDFAVLVQKKNQTIFIKDKYLLQSCLQSRTLDTENPDNVLSGLAVNNHAFSFTFVLLEGPDNVKTTVSVENERFRIKQESD
jgi:hypothetical protein